MKTVLGQLLNDLQSPDKPVTVEQLTQQSPIAPRARIIQQQLQSDGVAEELAPGLWRMLRRPAFPAEVWKLDWGRLGPPDYLRYTDHWYARRTGYRGTQWDLVAYTGCVPSWHFDHLRRPGDPVDDSQCCYQCGRRLAYLTQAGAEYCALCRPLGSPRIVRGEFSENAGEIIDESPNLENVSFFLRPGVGLDWNEGKPADWGTNEQAKA